MTRYIRWGCAAYPTYGIVLAAYVLSWATRHRSGNLQRTSQQRGCEGSVRGPLTRYGCSGVRRIVRCNQGFCAGGNWSGRVCVSGVASMHPTFTTALLCYTHFASSPVLTMPPFDPGLRFPDESASKDQRRKLCVENCYITSHICWPRCSRRPRRGATMSRIVEVIVGENSQMLQVMCGRRM